MIHNLLHDKKVILASQSPRRSLLFKALGIKFTIHPSQIEENHTIEDPAEFVLHNSALKAKDVAKQFPDAIVVGADTVVSKDKHIFVKPRDREDAFQSIKKLSNDYHYVYSGFTIIYQNEIISRYENTKVYFAHLSEQEIEDYIATGECDDKAGAYAIQGFGAQFITKIDGDYFTVMGFPIYKFYQTIKEMFTKK